MRLDVDVLRDVLLFLEDNLKVEYDNADGSVRSNDIDPYDLLIKLNVKRCPKREPAVIFYALRMLSDAGLINDCVQVGAQGDWMFSGIYDITFAGHEFIESVRDSTTWGKTKEIAKKAGCHAITFLSQVASDDYCPCCGSLTTYALDRQKVRA